MSGYTSQFMLIPKYSWSAFYNSSCMEALYNKVKLNLHLGCIGFIWWVVVDTLPKHDHSRVWKLHEITSDILAKLGCQCFVEQIRMCVKTSPDITRMPIWSKPGPVNPFICVCLFLKITISSDRYFANGKICKVFFSSRLYILAITYWSFVCNFISKTVIYWSKPLIFY